MISANNREQRTSNFTQQFAHYLYNICDFRNAYLYKALLITPLRKNSGDQIADSLLANFVIQNIKDQTPGFEDEHHILDNKGNDEFILELYLREIESIITELQNLSLEALREHRTNREEHNTCFAWLADASRIFNEVRECANRQISLSRLIFNNKMIEYDNRGNTYIGEHLNYLQQGKGTWFIFNDSVLDGYWDNGEVKHGRALQSDGIIYEGQFDSELKNGIGTLQYPDGSYYTGGFQNNLIHGEGFFCTPEGEYTVGIWENDTMHGEFIFIRGTHKYRELYDHNNKISGEYIEEISQAERLHLDEIIAAHKIDNPRKINTFEVTI